LLDLPTHPAHYNDNQFYPLHKYVLFIKNALWLFSYKMTGTLKY
jgi:hypothetical protein